MEKKSCLCGSATTNAFSQCDVIYKATAKKITLTEKQCKELDANGFVDIQADNKDIRVTLNR